MTPWQEEIFALLDRTWADVHELAARKHGPTEMVYSPLLGRKVEQETTASGSGWQNACEALVAQGRAEVQYDWRAANGRRYRRAL